MNKLVLFAILLLSYTHSVFSADPNLKICTKGIAGGMAIHAIAQDPTGMMWLATEQGLCSYDGYELRTFADRRLGMVSFMELSGDTLLIGGTRGLS